MNQINRFCTRKGHQKFQVHEICTYQECETKRQCCSQCISDGIHGHQLHNSNHIMCQRKLLAKVKQDIEKLEKDYSSSQQANQLKNLLLQLLKESKELEKLIITFRQNVERQLNNLMSDYDKLQLQSIIQEVEQNFHNIGLGNDNINQLLNINQYEFNYNSKQQVIDPLNKIQLQLNTLFEKVKYYQIENKNDKTRDLKSRKYVNFFITHENQHKYQYNQHIDSCIISNDEQYVVYNIENYIHIFDINKEKICKSILQENKITGFQYDNQQLFLGNVKGWVYGLDAQYDFQEFYNQHIHQDELRKIIIVKKQYLITCSKDKTIIKTDFINKQQIFKLVGHQEQVSSIDYDDQKEIIISSTRDLFIKIWDCSNQSIIIDYKCNSVVRQVQFINNKQNMLCLDSDGNVFKFKIDFQNLNLEILDKYKEILDKYKDISDEYDDVNIQAFQQVNNDQNLLVIWQEYCKILNNEFQVIGAVENKLSYRCSIPNNYKQQLDNLNYIILIDGNKICLLRAQDQN